MGKTTIDPTKNRDDEDDTSADDEDDDASDDGDEDDDSSDGDDEDDDASDDDEDDDDAAIKALGLSDAQLKYVKGLKGKLNKANAQSAAKRHRLAEMRKQNRAPKPGPAPTKRTSSKEPTIAEALAQFKAEQEAERAVERLQSAAERALRTAGLALPTDDDAAADRKMARAIKLLDLEGATIADIADLVDDLKADEPGMFKRKRKPKPRTGGVSGPARARSGSRAADEVERALDL